MLIKTSDIVVSTPEVYEDEPENLSFNQDVTQGYLKYGLYSRRTIFFHAFYKAYDLESFKGNIRNASILAEIFSHLIKYFIPDPSSWTVITTPKRAHTEKLGYHFASEVIKISARETGIRFIEDVIGAKNKNKISPEFFQLKPIPNTKLILFDDILTTGKTIYTTIDVLRSNPENKLNMNPLIIVGINNN